MILQASQQHVVKTGWANDFANRQAGKALQQRFRACSAHLTRQEAGIVGKTGNEAIDVIAELGIAAIHVRQVRRSGASFLRFHRAHGVGVDLHPFDDRSRSPVGGHAAHGEHIVVDRSAIGRQQANGHDRIGDDIHRRVERFRFGLADFVLFG